MYSYSYAQFGNGRVEANSDAGGQHTGNIDLTLTGNLNLAGDDSADRYAQFGNGGPVGFGTTSVAGDVQISVGGNLDAENAFIGNLVDGGTYNSGNTFIAVGTEGDSSSTLTANTSQFNSAAFGDDGELRIYLPRKSSLNLDANTTFNGTASADLFDPEGNLYNNQGNAAPFLGNYITDDTHGNFAFYLDLVGIWVVANSGSSIYGDTPINPGMSLDLNQGDDLLPGDTLQSIGLTTNFNLTSASDAGTYTLTINSDNLSSDYELLGTTSGTFTINKATLTFDSFSDSKTYGDQYRFGPGTS